MYAFIVGYIVIECSLAAIKAAIFNIHEDVEILASFFILQTIFIACFNVPVIFVFIRQIQIYLRVTR
jgi:hypothetical protein